MNRGSEPIKYFSVVRADMPFLCHFRTKTSGKEFKQGLAMAYHNVSNQILTKLIGLTLDPDDAQTWEKAALACVAK